MHLNLMVLRAHDMDALGRFYAALGMHFVSERHGNGALHLACSMGHAVFEIYPCTDQPTQGLRFGFCVEDVDACFETALKNGATEVFRPRKSPWGERAVISDPEGHIVELLKPAQEAGVALAAA